LIKTETAISGKVYVSNPFFCTDLCSFLGDVWSYEDPIDLWFGHFIPEKLIDCLASNTGLTIIFDLNDQLLFTSRQREFNQQTSLKFLYGGLPFDL